MEVIEFLLGAFCAIITVGWIVGAMLEVKKAYKADRKRAEWEARMEEWRREQQKKTP